MAVHNPEQLLAHAVEQLGAKLFFYLAIALCLSTSPYVLFRYMPPGWAFKPHSRVRTYVALTLVLMATIGQGIVPPLYTADALAQMRIRAECHATLVAHLQRIHMTTVGPATTLIRGGCGQSHVAGLVPYGDFEAVPRLAPFEPATEWSDLAKPYDVRRFNVILLAVESLRPEVPTLISHGSEVMPHLAAVQPLCAVLSNHFSQSSSSSYADIVLSSSQSPVRSETQHFYSSIHSYPRPRIYDLLKCVGYQTAIISSQDERWGGMDRYLKSEHLDLFFHAGNGRSTELYIEEHDGVFAAFARLQRSGKIDDAETIGYATEWIRSVKNTPFFLYTNLQNSHFPYRVPKGGLRQFWPNVKHSNVGLNGMTPEMVPEMYGRYLDSLHYVDQQIGRLFETLKEEDLLDDTLLVVTGDTGQAFLEHGYSNHGGPLYNEVLRTPCWILLPECLAAHRGVYDFVTSHINIAPTLISLLNLPEYQGFQGRSLFRDGAFGCPGTPHYMAVHSPLATQYGVVLDTHKLLYQPLVGQIELYNLAEDPEERRNLYDRNHLIGRQLEGLLRAHLAFQLDYYTSKSLVSLDFFPPRLPILEDLGCRSGSLDGSQSSQDPSSGMRPVSRVQARFVEGNG
ncbi:MAG: sulfatase-like hydrolase/transferase [Pirellulaceae bacterium]|nr:sulfatase-like hydrolase/transferase [Pirellulaceae bacterium]